MEGSFLPGCKAYRPWGKPGVLIYLAQVAVRACSVGADGTGTGLEHI